MKAFWEFNYLFYERVIVFVGSPSSALLTRSRLMKLRKHGGDLKRISECTHHEERVANPQTAPAHRALWDGDVLTVDCDGNWRGFTHGAAAYVWFDVSFFYRHHGKRSGGWQPVGLVISAGIVTNVSRVAVQEGHGAEPWEAGASQTYREHITQKGFMCSIWLSGNEIMTHIKQRVSKSKTVLLEELEKLGWGEGGLGLCYTGQLLLSV